GFSPSEKFDPECINPAYPHQLMAFAYNAKAYAAAEKGVSLQASLRWVAQAKAHAAQIPDESLRQSVMSAIWDTHACVVVRQGKIDDALRLYEKSLEVEADPEVYWHMAQALDRKEAMPGDPLVRLGFVQNAIDCCRMATKLDPWNRFGPEADILKGRLESRSAAIEAQMMAPAPVAVVNGSPVPAKAAT